MPLTQKQMEYLALAWQCFDSELKIDFEKFAKVAGLASANSARELMRVTKKKLKEEYGPFDGAKAEATSTPTKKTPASRKRSTPGTGCGKKGTAAMAADAESEDDGEDGDSSKKAKVGDGIKEEPGEDIVFQ